MLHQSDLLHGVRVESGDRWSWILWFYDGGDTCTTDPTQWFRAQALDGNPLAQFLQAKRAHMRPSDVRSSSTNGGAVDIESTRRQWLEQSAAGGFARAQNDLGALLLDDADRSVTGASGGDDDVMDAVSVDAFGSSSPMAATGGGGAAVTATATATAEQLRLRAAELFATASEVEADAMYNLGRLALREALAQAARKPGSAGPHFQKAVQIFGEAARMGSNLAMFNYGVAYQNGKGIARDFSEVGTQ